MTEADNQEEQALLDAERLLLGTEETKETPVKTDEEIAQETAAQEAEAARIAAETAAANPEDDDALTPHGEKSRLGRKLKRLEEEQGKKLSSIEETLKVLSERILTPKQEVEEELELPENPTAEEIKEFVKRDRERLLRDVEKRETEKSKQAQSETDKYSREYVKMIEDMLDPVEDAEIYKLMTDTKDLTYNQVYKRDAKEDFLINYRNATKAILTQSKTRKVISQGKAAPGVNVPGATKTEIKKVDTSKWSQQEQDMAKLLGDEALAEMGIG